MTKTRQSNLAITATDLHKIIMTARVLESVAVIAKFDCRVFVISTL